MAPFFRKSRDQHTFSGSTTSLALERLQFKLNQVSGIFEIQSRPAELELLVLGDGEETGAYRLRRDSHEKISLAAIGTGWEKEVVPIRSVAMPDHASRAVWQALECRSASREAVQGLAGWKAFLDRCYSDRLTGMLEISSDRCDG